MRHRHHRPGTVVLLAVALGLAAGCSDGDSGSSSTTATTASGATADASAPDEGAPDEEAPDEEAPDEGVTYEVPLSASDIGPEPGDPDLSGTATVTIRDDGAVCVELDLGDGFVPVTKVLLVDGPIAQQGGVIAELVPGVEPPEPPSGPPETGEDGRPLPRPIAGCGELPSDRFAELLADEPGRFGITVRTTDFPQGAVKGQLPAG